MLQHTYGKGRQLSGMNIASHVQNKYEYGDLECGPWSHEIPMIRASGKQELFDQMNKQKSNR